MSNRTVFAPVLAVVTCVLIAAPAASQLPEHEGIREAFLAWDRGDYVDALEGYLRVLDGPGGDTHLLEIAELTGEVHPVTEVAPDGSGLQISADGRYAAFRVEEGSGTVTRLADIEADGRIVGTLQGSGAVLSSDGRVAYFVVPETPEIMAARRALDEATDRESVFAARGVLARLEAEARELHVVPVDRLEGAAGEGGRVALEGRVPMTLAFAPDSDVLWVVAADPVGGAGPSGASRLLRIRGTAAEVVATVDMPVSRLIPVAGGAHLVMEGGGQGAQDAVSLLDLGTGETRTFPGAEDAVMAVDGSVLAFLVEEGNETLIRTVLPGSPAEARTLVRTEGDLANPAVSPSGTWVAYQKRPIHDWEIFAANVETGEEVQLTREIQHDLYPQFLDDGHVLAAKGEGRHRRSYVYEVRDAVDNVRKLFHNNTVRTIAPEYEWVATPGGDKVLIVSERDGDTVSPERAVYLVHRDRTVTTQDVRRRLESNLAHEQDLRARGEAAFAPIAEDVRRITERLDVGRIYQYAKVLHSYGSKYVTEPGNQRAIEYLQATLRSWGYEPELQWFDARGNRSANVIVRIPGTVDPDLVYVASSHFDSTQRGPGADDNSSGTTALLEVARVLKDHPLPATIELAWFTGEEAGLLGSREYVRRAQASGKHIVGALNNDMVGWANDHRLDNTIRYSNPGIRDIQHAAAIQFSDLILYDALYYKSTDAAAYYEAYGDIVGGIGSYPVLGNPHYHQFTDRLVTIDQRLVTEVGRVTAATLMLLASSPARLSDVAAERSGEAVEVRWSPAPESDVTRYRISWRDASGEARTREVGGSETDVRIDGVPTGATVRVRAINARGLEGWDWARVEVAPR